MAEKTKEAAVALTDQTLKLFEGNLRRIFAMKITRSTFRELQNVILSCANQDKNMANFLFESLLTGQVKQPLPETQQEVMDEVIRSFTIPARLAKEVYERGEFVNIITSDLISGPPEEGFAFLNRVRRIDGEEFVFLSDPENTLHLVEHFVARIAELDRNQATKAQFEKHKKKLALLVERLKQLSL